MTNRQDLGRRLREASEAELHELVSSHLEDIDPGEMALGLRNPFVSRRVLDLVAARRGLLRSYEVRRALASHPRTPPARSLNLVATLYWKDLVKLGADSRVSPRVRRAADYRLSQRLPSLAVGERMAIARAAGQGLIERLRSDPDPRVIGALLENPRLTEGQLGPLATDSGAPPAVLHLIAVDRKWARRYVLRRAISANPATPVATALDLLPSLLKAHLAELSADPRLAAEVRRRADLLRGADAVDRGERAD